ncbi:hypothetical protein QJQ45_010955 [Haematococcus lacustris]|nr:hypothetical protein QJQ45_010955 [Haematococcus lacustris]
MGLPAALVDDVARRALQLGAGGALSLTCRAFSNTNLSHAPSLHIQLNSQGCDQFLSGRSQFQLLTPVDAVLRARTCKLALTLEQQQDQHTGRYFSLVTKVLKKLVRCAAVEACKLGTIEGPSLGPLKRLSCSPSLAQHLMDSFPSLTSLSLHGYAIPCSGLATLLSHLPLALQLQQLDLTSTTITQPKRPEPGAATLDNLFHAFKLKQLSLSIKSVAGEVPLLPNLQPLSQHLTQLCIQQQKGAEWILVDFTAALLPLAQLQVLTMPGCHCPWGLPWLLRTLPQLHTLQLPDAVMDQEDLDTLLAATQLTSIQLQSFGGLSSSRVDVPCSWQRLELTGCAGCSTVAHLPLHSLGSVDCATAAYLPLHSLTQPLVLGALHVGAHTGVDRNLVAAAVHNLTQACKVPVRIKELHLTMSDKDTAAEQQVELQQLVAVLQALYCSRGRVCVSGMIVGAAEVVTLAPLYQGSHLVFESGSVTPSLEFWRQLVQLMPTVTNVVFERVDGSTSSAMHESLQLMAGHLQFSPT